MDGLSLPWFGTAFCNPPYERNVTELWIKKCHTEFHTGRATLIIALLAARPETKAWNFWIKKSADVFLLRKRLRYYENGVPGNTCPFPSAIVVWGASGTQLENIKQTFPDDWHIKKT
jgi:site-specific DNA-methyltransferase (adenine-specific)